MKILILATDIYTRGGIARYTATLASALGQLLGPENVDLLPLLDGSGHRFIPADYRILEATTAALTLRQKIRHTARALKGASRGYDLVICSHASLALLAWGIRLRHRTPYLVVCHGSEVWESLPALRRLALRQARCLLAVSRFTSRAMWEANGIPDSKIRLLPNAIPDDLVRRLAGPARNQASSSLQPGQPTGTVLLSVGSLSREHAYKGVDTVIEALPRIAEAVPNARYLVVGDGDNRSYLERLAARRGVADRVIFAGEVPDSELAGYYRRSDVFVLPSRMSRGGETGNRVAQGEGFGRVYLEAALAGKPVVGSRDGGAAEAVIDGRTGLLVNPRSASKVADAVIALLQAPERAAAMGAEGRRWALENFTVKAMRQSLENILASVASSVSSQSSAFSSQFVVTHDRPVAHYEQRTTTTDY
jgi:phosphatidylinositol alpha-1,6-mannosyltransferase